MVILPEAKLKVYMNASAAFVFVGVCIELWRRGGYDVNDIGWSNSEGSFNEKQMDWILVLFPKESSWPLLAHPSKQTFRDGRKRTRTCYSLSSSLPQPSLKRCCNISNMTQRECTLMHSKRLVTPQWWVLLFTTKWWRPRALRRLQMLDDIILEHAITKLCMYWLGFKSTIDRSRSNNTSSWRSKCCVSLRYECWKSRSQFGLTADVVSSDKLWGCSFDWQLVVGMDEEEWTDERADAWWFIYYLDVLLNAYLFLFICRYFIFRACY